MSSIKTRFLKNTSWLLAGNLFRMVFQFVVNILIARYLGPELQGTVNYVATYTAFFTSLVSLGLNGVIIHELVNHEDKSEILGTSIMLRGIIGFLSAGIMVAILFFEDPGNSIVIQIAFLQAIQLPFAALDTIKYWYQKNLESRKSVLVTTIAYALSCVYKIYILLTKKSVVWFGFVTSLDIILIGLLYIISYKREQKDRLKFGFDTAKRILKACLPFALANIMIFIYSKIDTIMIRHMMDSMTMIGYYTTAVTICGYISFVPTAILDSARPVIMAAKSSDKVRYERNMKRAILAVMSVGFLYALGISLAGRYMIKLLFGEAYLGALGSLRIAVWYTAFSFLGSAKSIWLICEGKNKYVLYFAVAGAISNVILNALMIPSGGIEGAAVATLLTQFLTHVAYPAVIPQTRGFVKWTIEAFNPRSIGRL